MSTRTEESNSSKVRLEAVDIADSENGDILSTAESRKREAHVKRKIDFLILPLLASVYFLAQMGRSDLNNAKIANMDDELGLSHDDYTNIASIFYVGYLVFQLPGTLLLRLIGPPRQFFLAMLFWGIITACTVKANGYAMLMVFRSLVGAAEAFIQGSILYLSFWYRYNELGTRGAIVYSTSALAGSFNGLLAYAIQLNLDGAAGLSAWQWIFLIEGVVPIAWAFVILFLLPNTPETISWGFKPEEKALVIKRSRASHNTGDGKIRPKLILKLLADVKFWMVTVIDCGAHFCASSMTNFLGDILKDLTTESEDSVESQLLTVIVYAVAFVAIIAVARISDKIHRRGYLISACSCVAVIGYALLLALTHPTARLVATCLVSAGTYPIVVLSLAWVASNNVGFTFRASAAALINVIAQAVSIAGNQAFNDPPYYRIGLGASLGMISLSGIMAFLLVLYLKRENAKKKRQQYTQEAEWDRPKSLDDIGNTHPDFFYSY
ncbi:putative pantothenate transporter [Whalleya microplaca]|nr:putative pantothenate transporter [Whalleya microplaca]